jgi:hypothetical protein
VHCHRNFAADLITPYVALKKPGLREEAGLLASRQAETDAFNWPTDADTHFGDN